MTHWRPAHDLFALRLFLQLSPTHTDAQVICYAILSAQASLLNQFAITILRFPTLSQPQGSRRRNVSLSQGGK
jgi:hypothetical protein